MFSFTTISILDKSDGDSMASKREAVAKAERAFKIFDKDNDGFITKEEFQKISKKLNKEQVQKLLVHWFKGDVIFPRHMFFKSTSQIVLSNVKQLHIIR